ncbi:MAG: hypothetical protein JW908_02770 [Anaerolineales bacterium]|nr:hypothetical protein [Anaerolineales bacterium]
MKKERFLLVIIVVLLVGFIVVGTAQAEGAVACGGGELSGTIIAVDETTGTVSVDTGGGATCTVTLSGNTDHPIASLLGQYFGDISAASLTEALTATNGCAHVSGGAGAWASCDSPGAVPVQVISANPDGTFTAQITNPDGSVTTLILTVEDPAQVESLNQALTRLVVVWTLDESGDLVQVSDQVMAYHEAGVGFGVLVKLYSLSNASGIPVAELLAEFQSGVGIGELFKSYGGKPAETGVGHVKQALNTTTTPSGVTPGVTNNGNHNGQENNGDNGNGHTNNGNANGKDKPKKPKK